MPEEERQIIDAVAESGSLRILGFADKKGKVNKGANTVEIGKAINRYLDKKVDEKRGCPVPVRALVAASIAQKLVRD